MLHCSSWLFVVVHYGLLWFSCGGSLWFNHGGSLWFVVVHCGLVFVVLLWFFVVCCGFSLKISRKKVIVPSIEPITDPNSM